MLVVAAFRKLAVLFLLVLILNVQLSLKELDSEQ